MTGGGTFRAEVGADGVFDRLRRELGGYYRIGIEKDRSDAGARNRRMKVQVARSGLTIRARDLFDVRMSRGPRLGGADVLGARFARARLERRPARDELCHLGS